MIPYEEYLPLLSHEYSYARYLSYGFDLCLYDPMILNMVSEQYPRDKDYAFDFDSVTGEDRDSDFSDEVPPWLFEDLEEEDSSPQENDNFNIVFGSFGDESDLDMVFAPLPISIKVEFDEFTIQIGEILCPLAAVESSDDSDDEGSLDNEATILFVKHESNTMKEIKTGFISRCSVRTEDEVQIDLCKSINPDLAKQLQKHRTFPEISLSTSIFISNANSRFSSGCIVRSSSLLDVADDFVYAKSILDLSILEEMLKELHLEDPRTEVPYHVTSVVHKLNLDLNVSPVEDGYDASMERRWKKEAVKRTPQPPPCKPPDPPPLELHDSCYWLSPMWHQVSSLEPPWELFSCDFQPHDPDVVRLLLVCAFVVLIVHQLGRIPFPPSLGHLI